MGWLSGRYDRVKGMKPKEAMELAEKYESIEKAKAHRQRSVEKVRAGATKFHCGCARTSTIHNCKQLKNRKVGGSA